MHRLTKIVYTVAVSALLIFLSPKAFAEEIVDEAIPSDSNTSLQISPVTKRLSISPSETSTHTLEIKTLEKANYKSVSTLLRIRPFLILLV